METHLLRILFNFRFLVNVWMMMIVYGVVGGFGLGLIYLPSVIAVGHYFEAKVTLYFYC